MKHLTLLVIFLATSVSSFAVVGSISAPNPIENSDQILNKKVLRKEKRANRKVLRKMLWAKLKSQKNEEKKTGSIALALSFVGLVFLFLSVLGSLSILFYVLFVVPSTFFSILSIAKNRQSILGAMALAVSALPWLLALVIIASTIDE